jgi:hypothetical protein
VVAFELKEGRARVLHEAVPHPPDVLAEQHSTEFLETRWRVIERTDDRLALGDREHWPDGSSGRWLR